MFKLYNYLIRTTCPLFVRNIPDFGKYCPSTGVNIAILGKRTTNINLFVIINIIK